MQYIQSMRDSLIALYGSLSWVPSMSLAAPATDFVKGTIDQGLAHPSR